MYKRTVEHLKEINSLPSSPFAVDLQVKYVELCLQKYGYKYEKTPYRLTVHIPSNTKTKLVVMSHLDHPGAVLNGKGGGIFFGSVGLDRIEKKIKSGFYLRVISSMGEKLGLVKLTGMGRNKQNFTYSADFVVPRNSSAQFDIPVFEEDDDYLRVYNSDNAIDTATMLALLEEKFIPVYDTYFVFNIHEEVHQISAWKLARDNELDLGKHDMVLNLESPIITTNEKYDGPKLTYVDGPVMKLSNLGCLFGFMVAGENELEKRIELIAKKNNHKVQKCFAKGSDESRCFSSFANTASIVTLAIPNKYKHNWGTKDEFVAEEILKKDVKVFGVLLYDFLTTPVEEKELRKTVSLSDMVKKRDSITDRGDLKKKMILNNRLDIRYRPVVLRGYYFPESITDLLFDKVFGAGSYLYWFWANLTKR